MALQGLAESLSHREEMLSRVDGGRTCQQKPFASCPPTPDSEETKGKGHAPCTPNRPSFMINDILGDKLMTTTTFGGKPFRSEVTSSEDPIRRHFGKWQTTVHEESVDYSKQFESEADREIDLEEDDDDNEDETSSNNGNFTLFMQTTSSATQMRLFRSDSLPPSDRFI